MNAEDRLRGGLPSELYANVGRLREWVRPSRVQLGRFAARWAARPAASRGKYAMRLADAATRMKNVARQLESQIAGLDAIAGKLERVAPLCGHEGSSRLAERWLQALAPKTPSHRDAVDVGAELSNSVAAARATMNEAYAAVRQRDGSEPAMPAQPAQPRRATAAAMLRQLRALDRQFDGTLEVNIPRMAVSIVTPPVVLESKGRPLELGRFRLIATRGILKPLAVALEPNRCPSAGSTVHPHVDGRDLCMGATLANSIERLLQADQVYLALTSVASFLAHYMRGGNPYASPESWFTKPCSRCNTATAETCLCRCIACDAEGEGRFFCGGCAGICPRCAGPFCDDHRNSNCYCSGCASVPGVVPPSSNDDPDVEIDDEEEEDDDTYACDSCGERVSTDDTYHCDSCDNRYCSGCDDTVSCESCNRYECSGCGGVRSCTVCSANQCARHRDTCEACGEPVCGSNTDNDCALMCDACNDTVCKDCVVSCAGCGSHYCPDCSTIEDCASCDRSGCGECSMVSHCNVCGTTRCESHRVTCAACGKPVCETGSSCTRACVGCGDPICSNCDTRCDDCDSYYCSSCAEADGACPACHNEEPTSDEEDDDNDADASGPGADPPAAAAPAVFTYDCEEG